MPKVTSSQKKVLSVLLFHENIDTIQLETGFQFGEIRDDITQLIHSGHLEIFEHSDHGLLEKTFHYDTDNLRRYLFRVTGKGQLEI